MENHPSLANVLCMLDEIYITNLYCQLHQIAKKKENK